MQLRDEISGEKQVGARNLTAWPSWLGRWLVRLAKPLARRVSANAVLWITAGIGCVLVLALTVAGSGIYESVEEGEGLAGIDRPILDAAIDLRTPKSDRLITWFTNLGGAVGMTIIAATITLAMVLRWRSRTPLLLMVIAVAGSLSMTSIGKIVVGRVRPDTADAVPPYETSPSFPSGHALNSTVIAGLVAYLLLLRLTSRLSRIVTVVLAAAWAVAMGLSRVVLGHHWLTDVMFGWTLGLAWLCVVITAHRLYLTVRNTRRGST